MLRKCLKSEVKKNKIFPRKRKLPIVDDISKYLEEYWPYHLDRILLADGFEEAFLGITESFGLEPRACYSTEKCLSILMKRDSMTYDEATEYLTFNVTQAYVGESTPAFISLMEDN